MISMPEFESITALATALAVLVAIITTIATSIQSLKARKLQSKEINLSLLEQRLQCCEYIDGLQAESIQPKSFIKEFEIIRCLFSKNVYIELVKLDNYGNDYRSIHLSMMLARALLTGIGSPRDSLQRDFIKTLPHMLAVEDIRLFLANIDNNVTEELLVEFRTHPETRDKFIDYLSKKSDVLGQMVKFQTQKKRLLESMRNEITSSVKDPREMRPHK